MTALNSIDQQLQSLEFAELKMISRRSEERATKVVRVLTDPSNETIIDLNGCWHIISGTAPKDVIGKKWGEMIPTRYRLSSGEQMNTAVKDGGFSGFSCPIMREDGHEVAVNWYAKHLPEINRVIKIGHISLSDYAECLKWNNG